MTKDMSPVDAVMEQIMKGCRAKVSSDIKAKLRAGKEAIAKVAKLEKENINLKNKLKALEKDITTEVKKYQKDKDNELNKEKDKLRKQRQQLIMAARKVNRGITGMERLKKKTLRSLINDRSHKHWYNDRTDADAVRTIKALAKHGRKALNEIKE